MNSIKLVSISAIIVLSIASIPHLFHSHNLKKLVNEKKKNLNEISLKNEYSNNKIISAKTNAVLPSKHILEGKWKVSYKDVGSAIYHLKKENDILVGYSTQLFDTNGQSIEDNSKVFILKSFQNYKGKCVYYLKYENETYNIPCDIELKSNRLYVSYDFYGHKDTEIWTKL